MLASPLLWHCASAIGLTARVSARSAESLNATEVGGINLNQVRLPKQQLRQIGWTKARELAKVARREGERFGSAPWVHKAQALPKEELKREVERHLTGTSL